MVSLWGWRLYLISMLPIALVWAVTDAVVEEVRGWPTAFRNHWDDERW